MKKTTKNEQNTAKKHHDRQDRDTYNQILKKVREGNFVEAENILKRMNNINYKASDGQALLHHACFTSSESLVNKLIELGADVNVKNNEDATPAFFAVSASNLNSLKILHEHGADINYMSEINPTTLLHQAIATNASLETVSFLIEKNCHLDTQITKGSTPLLTVIGQSPLQNDGFGLSPREKKLAIIHLLLKQKVNVNAKTSDGRNALYLVLKDDDVELMKLLIDHGADVNARDAQGVTLLLRSIYDKKTRVFNFLIERNDVIIDIADDHGTTPLQEAVLNNNEYFVKKLLEKKININAFDQEGRSALIHATYLQNKNIVELLINNGANLNHCDYAGKAPLHCAALAGGDNAEIFELLIKKGANINIQDSYGCGPVHYVTAQGKVTKKLIVLQQHGADFNLSDKEGITPLFAAIQTKQLVLIKYVVKVGNAKVNMKTETGASPICHAVKINCSPEIIDFLLSQGAGLSATNEYDETLLMCSIYRSDPFDIRSQLKLTEKDFYKKNQKNQTVLHLAVIRNNIKMVHYLLRFLDKSSQNLKDVDERTPLSYAIENNRHKMIKLFHDFAEKTNTVASLAEEAIYSAIKYDNEAALELFLPHSPFFPWSDDFKNKRSIKLFNKFALHVSEIQRQKNDYISFENVGEAFRLSVRGDGNFLQKNKQNYSRELILSNLDQSLIKITRGIERGLIIKFDDSKDEYYYRFPENKCYLPPRDGKKHQIESSGKPINAKKSIVLPFKQKYCVSKAAWSIVLSDVAKTPALPDSISSNDFKMALSKGAQEIAQNNDDLIIAQRKLAKLILNNSKLEQTIENSISAMLNESSEFKKYFNITFDNEQNALKEKFNKLEIEATDIDLNINMLYKRLPQLKDQISTMTQSVTIDFLSEMQTEAKKLNRDICLYKNLITEVERKLIDVARSYITFSQQVAESKALFDMRSEVPQVEPQIDVLNETVIVIEEMEEEVKEEEAIVQNKVEESVQMNNQCSTALLQRMMRNFNDAELTAIKSCVTVLFDYAAKSSDANEFLFPATLYVLFEFSKYFGDAIFRQDKLLCETDENIQHLRNLRNLHRHINSYGNYAEIEQANHSAFMKNVLVLISPFLEFFSNGNQFLSASILIKDLAIDLDLGCVIYDNITLPNDIVIENAQQTLNFAFDKLKEIVDMRTEDNVLEQVHQHAARMFTMLISDSCQVLKKQFYSTYKAGLGKLDADLVFVNHVGIKITFLEHYMNCIAHAKAEESQFTFEKTNGDPAFDQILLNFDKYKKFFVTTLHLSGESLIVFDGEGVDKTTAIASSSFSYREDKFGLYSRGAKLLKEDKALLSNLPRAFDALGFND